MSRVSQQLDQIITELRGIRQQAAAVREILTIEEAADYLRMSPYTLRDKVRLRQIPFFKVGSKGCGSIRFRRSSLDRWVDRGEVPEIER